MKIHKLFSGIPFNFTLFVISSITKFETEILDLQSEKYGLSFDIKKYTTSGWALGDENVIGIRAFNEAVIDKITIYHKKDLTFKYGFFWQE